MTELPSLPDSVRIDRPPVNDNTNAWNTILDERQPCASLDADIVADWVVVGAGYAGLAAARRLAENRPNQKIVVLEAGVCGENASGRNSGFAIDLPHTTSSNLDQLDGAHRHMRLARAAIDELSIQVHDNKISCDWSVDGKYHAAVTERGSDEMLEPFARELDALGEPYEWVNGDLLAARIGTRHFKKAIHTPGCVLMNPAALVRGLADALPSNVSLFENSAVTAFHTGNGVTLETANGSIRAPRMILAANGFSEQFGTHHNRFVHLALHASLTRPLDQKEREAYGIDKPWGLTPANGFGGVTMRYTNDHRLLIRQDIKLSMNKNISRPRTQTVAAQHKKILNDRFPSVPGLTFENTWVGYICVSKNGAPAFGPAAHNVWLAACQNGIGITKGTISGLLAADLACEQDNPLITDMQSLGQPVTLPPRPLVEVGARAKLHWEIFKNRHEA